jgi:hypothetical protein
LRIEALSNNLRNFRVQKSLDNLDTVRQTLANVTDRFANFQAHAMDVHIETSLSSSAWLSPLLPYSANVRE